MKTRIFVMTHKPFEVPEDPMYVPVHVGRALHPASADSGALMKYTGDDSGDHISAQNCFFSELTGMYWVWKNVTDIDNVGICHYRRYLLNEQGYMFTGAEIDALLTDYDVVTTKSLQLNYSYYEGFGSHHRLVYLDEAGRILAECYPEYGRTFERLVHEKHTYFGNMLICKKEIYDAYCEWLFAILFELQKRVPVEEEDSYHRRIFGFLSEFLQFVWIRHRGLRVYECMVGMLGEKAEVRETKQRLAEFFAAGDVEGAKRFFLEARRLRPDLLMEASDVTGELHLCMEVIAIAGLEQEQYGRNLLDHIRDFGELMAYCNRLNRYVTRRGDFELQEWAAEKSVTAVAIHVASEMMAAAGGGNARQEDA